MSTQALKETLKNQPTAQADPAKTVQGYLNSMKNEIQKALPKHLTADRLSRIVMTSVRLNPKLLQCTPESLIGAVMQAAQLGLEPGILGSCYLIPYGNVVQFQIGYQGMIDLSRRSGDLAQITVQAVHENDEFSYMYGSDQHLKHVPAMSDRGDVIAYYCYTKLKNGEENFSVMGKQDVEKHRDKFTKSKTGPWTSDFDSMALKTVIKRHFKYMPVSVELREQLSKDEVKADINGEVEPINDLIDITPTEDAA